MKTPPAPTLPTAADIRAAMVELTGTEVRRLAEQSGVPLTTLWNLRTGETCNPAIGTLGKFWPLIPAIRAAREPAGA